MGVKKKSSEYQHAFKSVHPCFTAVYEKNFDYRTNRRLTEHNHHVDPFDWDPVSESSSESGISISNGPRVAKRPPSVPLHIYKHEKFNKSYRDRLNQLSQQFAQGVQVSQPQQITLSPSTEDVQHEAEVPLTARSQESGVQTDLVEQVDRAVNGSVEVYPLDQPVNKAPEIQESKPTATAVVQKKQTWAAPRPRRPVHKPSPSAHSPRASSAPPTKAAPRKSASKDGPQKSAQKPPFVSYGCLDDEKSVTKKFTYNVRASSEIHPSALLAKKRRQADTASKKAKAVKATTKKRPFYDDFNIRTKRETTQWDTEYRSHYAGYEKGIYEHNISTRPITRIHDPQLLVTTW